MKRSSVEPLIDSIHRHLKINPPSPTTTQAMPSPPSPALSGVSLGEENEMELDPPMQVDSPERVESPVEVSSSTPMLPPASNNNNNNPNSANLSIAPTVPAVHPPVLAPVADGPSINELADLPLAAIPPAPKKRKKPSAQRLKKKRAKQRARKKAKRQVDLEANAVGNSSNPDLNSDPPSPPEKPRKGRLASVVVVPRQLPVVNRAKPVGYLAKNMPVVRLANAAPRTVSQDGASKDNSPKPRILKSGVVVSLLATAPVSSSSSPSSPAPSQCSSSPSTSASSRPGPSAPVYLVPLNRIVFPKDWMQKN